MLQTLFTLRANHRVRQTALVLSLAAALGGCGGDAVKDAIDTLTDGGGLTTTTGTTTGTTSTTTGGDAAVTGLTGLTGLTGVTTGDAGVTTGDVSTTTGDASTTTGDASTTTGDASTTTGDASTTTGDASTTTGDAGVVDAGPEPEGGIEGELGQLFGDGGLFGGPAPDPDGGFTPPPTSTGWSLNPDSSDNCPAEPPPTPIDPCLGIYWACGWEHSDGRTYSCICDWIHYLCI